MKIIWKDLRANHPGKEAIMNDATLQVHYCDDGKWRISLEFRTAGTAHPIRESVRRLPDQATAMNVAVQRYLEWSKAK